MMLGIDLPDSMLERMSRLARSENRTIGEVIATACHAHLAAWDRLEARARRGSREKFLAVLAEVPDVPPTEGDELPPPKTQSENR